MLRKGVARARRRNGLSDSPDQISPNIRSISSRRLMSDSQGLSSMPRRSSLLTGTFPDSSAMILTPSLVLCCCLVPLEPACRSRPRDHGTQPAVGDAQRRGPSAGLSTARGPGALSRRELRQLLDLVPACPRQHDLTARVIQNQRLIGDGHQATAQAEKAADLEHREENAVATNDDVIDGADPLVVIINDIAARQLARPVALRDGRHVDNDEFNRLRTRWSWADSD